MNTRVLECLLGRDREGSTPDSAPMLGASAAVCRSENTPGFTGSELIVTFLSPPLTLCPPYVILTPREEPVRVLDDGLHDADNL